MEELEALNRTIRACTLCPLSQSRTQAVPGDGPAKAEIMFIGEGPGFYEDRQGKPFVGPAGQYLNELLKSAGLKREDVYITNVVKCRPLNNRDPLPSEIEACAPYLEAQMRLIDPKVLVTLGRFSAARFFPGESISKLQGKAKKIGGRIYYPMFHPAAALHQPRFKEPLEKAVKELPKLLEEARAGGQGDIEEPPKQLTLL